MDLLLSADSICVKFVQYNLRIYHDCNILLCIEFQVNS
jgi:hypothetical protein